MQCKRPQFDSWVGKICWRRDRQPTPYCHPCVPTQSFLSFLNYFMYLFGCIRFYLWHVGSSLQCMGFLAVVLWLSCPMVCGILVPNQESNPCSLHWNVGSFFYFLIILCILCLEILHLKKIIYFILGCP